MKQFKTIDVSVNKRFNKHLDLPGQFLNERMLSEQMLTFEVFIVRMVNKYES